MEVYKLLTLKLNDDGDSFQPNRILEVIRILRSFSDRLECFGGECSSDLIDSKGNLVGRAQFHHKNQKIPENFIEDGL